MDIGTYLAIGSFAVGTVVWGIRLEGRVNGHQTLFNEREKQSDDRHEDLKDRLTRIEAKLDRIHGARAS